MDFKCKLVYRSELTVGEALSKAIDQMPQNKKCQNGFIWQVSYVAGLGWNSLDTKRPLGSIASIESKPEIQLYKLVLPKKK